MAEKLTNSLEARQAEVSNDFLQSIRAQVGSDPDIVAMWAGHPNSLRQSAAHGVGVAYTAETPSELSEHIKGFSNTMRKTLGKGVHNDEKVGDFLEVIPARFSTTIRDTTARVPEAQYALFLLEGLEELSETLTSQEGTPPSFTEARIETAILAAKVHHLHKRLPNGSYYNSPARLEIMNDLMRNTLNPPQFDDELLDLTPKPLKPYVPEVAPLPTADDIAKIRSNREIIKPLFDGRTRSKYIGYDYNPLPQQDPATRAGQRLRAEAGYIAAGKLRGAQK